MALGFAPAKTKQELTKQSQSAQKAKLTSIAEIQANFSTRKIFSLGRSPTSNDL